MAVPSRRSYTFLDDITLGDDELESWDSALSGSQDFVQELLELGEDSLEFSAAEDELRKLQSRLNDAEAREARLKKELSQRDDKIEQLENLVEYLKKEISEDRARAKDEAEDMAQEIAELRYQMNGMLEEERQLRAQTEKLSVLRVEELELQVKQAREETVIALARRQEAECQAEKEVLYLRLELQEAERKLEDANVALEESKQLCEELSRLRDKEANDSGVTVAEHTVTVTAQDAEASDDKEASDKDGEDDIVTVPHISEDEQAPEGGKCFGNEDMAFCLQKAAEVPSNPNLDLQQAVNERYEVELKMAQKEIAELQEQLRERNDLSENFTARIKAYEAELQSARASQEESASRCSSLNKTLGSTVEKLIRTEAELQEFVKQNETLQRSVEAAEVQLSEATREKRLLQGGLLQLKESFEGQEQIVQHQQQELRASNNQLMQRIGELSSELTRLQQQLITCQTQVSEMAMKNVILEDTLSTKKRRIKECEEIISEQADKLARQGDKYSTLQGKLMALESDFSALEAKLGESRRREQEARIQAERLNLELGMAKQEVVNSEVRLQKYFKDVEVGKSRVEFLLNKQNQNERYLSQVLEQLKEMELENKELRCLAPQKRN